MLCCYIVDWQYLSCCTFIVDVGLRESIIGYTVGPHAGEIVFGSLAMKHIETCDQHRHHEVSSWMCYFWTVCSFLTSALALNTPSQRLGCNCHTTSSRLFSIFLWIFEIFNSIFNYFPYKYEQRHFTLIPRGFELLSTMVKLTYSCVNLRSGNQSPDRIQA